MHLCVYLCFGSFQGVRHSLDSVLAEEARSDGVDTRRDVPFPIPGGGAKAGAPHDDDPWSSSLVPFELS